MTEELQAVVAVDLTKRFASSYAVRDISLTIAPCSTLLVVGPNGAGKTTLLRLLATAVRPTAGRAEIFGHDLVRDADTVRRLSAFLGTAHGMYETLTPHENLAFAAAMSGRPMPVGHWLERVGLGSVAHRPLRTLSQGMKRRLALARLALLGPRLLLLDEPFAGLDAEGMSAIDTLVDEVKARGGSVVLATHEWERGLRLADATIALADGRQIAINSASRMSSPTVRTLARGRT